MMVRQVSLDGLEGQTMQIALLGSQIGTKQEITESVFLAVASGGN